MHFQLQLWSTFFGGKVIAAATNRVGSPWRGSTMSTLFDDSGLDQAVLNRPVTTLSGGERMLVSIVKASYLVKEGANLVVCSPFYWLDPGHRLFVHEVLDQHARNNVSTRLITLDGEVGAGAEVPQDLSVQAMDWRICFERTSVVFPAISFPRESAEKSIAFLLPDGEINLVSPTLISGPNGIGKSTFAKILSGLVRSTGDAPEIVLHGFSGTRGARLLMQDAIIQLFGDSPKAHLERVFLYDKTVREKAMALFETMQGNCAKANTVQIRRHES